MDALLNKCAKRHTQNKDFFIQNLQVVSTKQSTKVNTLKVWNKNKRVCNDKYIDFMFYTPGPKDFVINKVVAKVTAGESFTNQGEIVFSEFAHTELSFKLDPYGNKFEGDKCMAFSITQGSNVFFKPKHWRSEYTSLRLYIPHETYHKLYDMCTVLALQNIKFDQFAMYTAVSIVADPNRTREKHGTYCTKIIVEVLQIFDIGGPIIHSIIPCKSTPSLLYESLRKLSAH